MEGNGLQVPECAVPRYEAEAPPQNPKPRSPKAVKPQPATRRPQGRDLESPKHARQTSPSVTIRNICHFGFRVKGLVRVRI